jgi:hypothetical protein
MIVKIDVDGVKVEGIRVKSLNKAVDKILNDNNK